MYSNCLAGADDMLELLLIVAVLVIAASFVALGRQTRASRRYRDLFQDARADARIYRRERDQLMIEKLFPDRETLKR